MKLLPDKSVIAVIELVEMTIHTTCVGFDKLNHRIFYLSGSFFYEQKIFFRTLAYSQPQSQTSSTSPTSSLCSAPGNLQLDFNYRIFFGKFKSPDKAENVYCDYDCEK